MVFCLIFGGQMGKEGRREKEVLIGSEQKAEVRLEWSVFFIKKKKKRW